MCDYSLHNVASRPAKVGDKLTTRDFGTGTRGFAASEDSRVAVCVLPGTELAFARPVERAWRGLLDWFKDAQSSDGNFSADQPNAAGNASRRAGISGRSHPPLNQPVGRSRGRSAAVAGTAHDRVGGRVTEARRVRWLSIRADTQGAGRPPGSAVYLAESTLRILERVWVSLGSTWVLRCARAVWAFASSPRQPRSQPTLSLALVATIGPDGPGAAERSFRYAPLCRYQHC